MFLSSIVTIMVSDFEKSIQFYTKALGLKLAERWGNDFAYIDAPDLRIGLHPMSEKGPKPETSGGMSIGLSVKNIEEATETLKERGVNFPSDIQNDGYVRLNHFEDLDGNPFCLSELKSK